MPTIDKIVRLKDGTLPLCAWPGGYPLIYWFEDGRACCPRCANDILSDPVYYPQDTDCPDDRQWHIVGYDVFYEGKAYCEGCCQTIESAYGLVEDRPMIVTATKNSSIGSYDVRIGDIGTFEMSCDAHQPNGVCIRYDDDTVENALDGPAAHSLPIGVVRAIASIAYDEGRRVGAIRCPHCEQRH